MEWEESWKSSYKLDCGTDFLPPDMGLTCEQTLWKGSLGPDKELVWNSVLRLTQCHLLQQAWCAWPLNDPDPAAEMCSGKSNFPVPFSYVCSFLIQRVPNNDFIRTDAISFVSVWISQKKQPLLGFNSQVIVQNCVPRQKYDQQYYSGFSFSGSFVFISIPFKLVINFVFLFMDWIFKDSTQTFRNTQTFRGCVSWGGFFLISG